MEIEIAVSKIDRFGSASGGESLEAVERPNGGVSVVLSKGMQQQKNNKQISNLVVRNVIKLIAEGVRDGAAARAAADALFTDKHGEASASLNILSADIQTCTIVLTCNNPTPMFIIRNGKIDTFTNESSLIGSAGDIRPFISEIPLEADLFIILFTSGFLTAGKDNGRALDIPLSLSSMIEDSHPTSQQMADALLSQALKTDQNQPSDDMCVVVMHVLGDQRDGIRRMSVSMPFPLQQE